jgi:hypothetical protein
MKRSLLATAVLSLFALAWNACVHLFVLADLDASVRHLRRSDFAEKAWLSILLTVGIVLAFVLGYRRIVRTGTVREAVAYGAGFGALAGLLVDLNQYVLYPLPGRVAAAWFAFGLAEFVCYGLIARLLLPLRRRA